MNAWARCVTIGFWSETRPIAKFLTQISVRYAYSTGLRTAADGVGPPSLLGLTAEPRADPLASLARRRDACCTCLRRSSATPRYLRDPFEHHACQQLARRRELAWVRRALRGRQLD